jgi:hypothetical protein
MDRNEIHNILNGMCERCLMRGMISTLDDAKLLCDTFDRFCNNDYTNDKEYSQDILYLYDLATKLHESGNTSLEESYSIYSVLLSADSVDFVEINDSVENHEENGLNEVEHIVEETIVKIDPIKFKKNNKKTKDDEDVVDISDIVIS